MTTLTPPSGFTPRALTSWNKYFVPQSDTNAYRVGDAVKSAGGTDAAGTVAVTLHLGTGPSRGVIVSVDPGLPATGGLAYGQKLSIPATKLMGYYVWVLDDPSAVFTMVDDGLTPGNSVASSAGKYANYTPGAGAAANGGSTSAITSSTLGSSSGCLQVISLQPGSAYGAAATWLVKFAAHELANGGGAASSGVSSFSALTDKASADIVGTNTGVAAVAAMATAAFKPPMTWAASPGGGTPTLTSGTAVPGKSFLNTTTSLVTLNPSIDGITQVAPGDILVCFTAGSFTLLPAGGLYLGVFGSTGALPTSASNAGNSALVGSTLYFCNGASWAALGSGGVSTLSALSDVGSYDLGSNNPSVAAIKATASAAAPASALAATNAALATVKPANTTWSTIWDTSAAKDFGEFAISAALALTSSDLASTVGGYSEAVLIADGSHIPTFDGSTLSNWQNTAGARNRVELRRVGNSKFWLVGANLGAAIVTPVNAQITSAPVINPLSAGSAVTWTAGTVTGAPTPTVSYSLKKNGTVVSSPATSGSYNTTAQGDIFVVTQAATNAANGGGTATPVDSAPVTASAAPLRFASPNNTYPSGTYSYNLGTGATNVGSAGWFGMLIGQDMTSLAIGTPMNYMAAAAGVTNLGNSLSITAMAVVYNGQYVAVTWAGSQSVTIADASNAVSDIINASQFGAAKFAKGDTIQIKYTALTTAATTEIFPFMSGPGTTSGHAYYDTTKVTLTSSVYSTTPDLSGYSVQNGGVNGTDRKFGLPIPAIILGNHTSPAFALIGDSKTRGTGDTGTGAVGAAGMTRALFSGVPTSANIIYSGINMGIPSGTTAETLTAHGAPVSAMEFWWKYATHAIVGYGTNAFQLSNQTALYARLRANGITKIIQRSLTPRTATLNSMPVSITSLTSSGTAVTGTMADTSGLVSGQSYPIAGAAQSAYNGTFAITVVNGTTFTYTALTAPSASPATGTLTLDDQWRTTKYQVANSAWAVGQGADTYEQSLRGTVSSDANYFYYQSMGERASPTLGTAGYWQWGVNGTAKYMTGDGLHETAVGYEANVNTPGTVSSQAGGTVSQSLRQLIASF